MFIWHEIESIEHSARNFPTVKATADVPNGYVCGLSDGAPAAPAAATEALYVAINDIQGDNKYVDGAIIHAGEMLNLYDLAAWDGREMIVTAPNLAGTYADIAVGDTLKADANGKLAEAGLATVVTFKVLDKLVINGVNGVRVKVVKGEPTT